MLKRSLSKQGLPVVVGVFLVFLLGACGGEGEEEPFDPSTLGGTLIESDVDRVESGATAAQLEAYTQGQTEFAIRFLRNFDGDESAVFSPYNLAEAMTLAATFGVFSESEREAIEMAVGVEDPASTYEASNSFRHLMDARLQDEQERLAADSEARERFAYANLNDLWVEDESTARGFDIDSFQRYFGVGVRVTELGSNTEKGAETINEYIEYYTNGLIPELLSPGQLTDVFAVVTTALYVKAGWRATFRETSEKEFVQGPDQSSSVMYMRGDANIMTNLDPFTGEQPDDGPLFVSTSLHGNLAFDIIAPEAGTLSTYLDNFDRAAYEALRRESEGMRVYLEMPVFKTDSSPRVKGLMISEFGVPTSVFDLGKIGDIIHQSVIDVNETGIEAAAATAVTFFDNGDAGPDFDLIVDRSFLYFLRDQETGIILFAGIYVGD